MSGDFRSNVTSDSFWIRTIYTVIFVLISRILDLVLLLATLVQWVSQLISGEPNKSLAGFCYSLGIYYQQVTHFLTGVSNDKSFPFSDWPEAPTNKETPDTEDAPE